MNTRCRPGLAHRECRIAVIGTGALGSAVLEVLQEWNLSSVLLIDPDIVEERNLALSPLLRSAMHHRSTTAQSLQAEPPNKAQLLAWNADTFHHLPWRALPVEVADVGWEILRDIDLFCCCTDSVLSRIETAYIARIAGKPMIDGAVFGNGIFGGRVSYFPPDPGAACYLCGMSEDSRATHLGYAASASMGCRLPEHSPAMTGTRDALQHVARSVADVLIECSVEQATQATAVRLQRVEGDAAASTSPPWDAVSVLLPRSATCPWHEEAPASLLALPWEEPLRSALQAYGAQPSRDLQLAWPICTEAVCVACGSHSKPYERVGRVRHALPCPCCGQVQLQPVRAVHRICAEDDLSRRSPRQLGQPKHHLYRLRDTGAVSGFLHEDAS